MLRALTILVLCVNIVLGVNLFTTLINRWLGRRRWEERIARDLIWIREERGIDPERFLIGMVGRAQALELEDEEARVMSEFLARRRRQILSRVRELESGGPSAPPVSW
jgi:hypothetical protein